MRTFCFSLLPILILLPFTSWGGQHIVTSKDGRQFLLETSDTKNEPVVTHPELTNPALLDLVKRVNAAKPAPPGTASEMERSDYRFIPMRFEIPTKIKQNPDPKPMPNPKPMSKPISTPTPKSNSKPSAPSGTKLRIYRSRSLFSRSLSTCRGSGLHGVPCTTWVKSFNKKV